MCIFQVYEFDSDGNKHYTGKKISVSRLPQIENGYIYNRGSIVEDLFAAFGFSQYINSYNIVKINDKDFDLTYNYIEGGVKPTWYLKRGA
jgi:hypothetical protein